MTNKVAIIASNGGVFDAYKVFNITTAAATDQEVTIFFTFEGFRKANVPSIPELVSMA